MRCWDITFWWRVRNRHGLWYIWKNGVWCEQRGVVPVCGLFQSFFRREWHCGRSKEASSLLVCIKLVCLHTLVMKSENSTAQIKCTNDSSMHFTQSQYIHITNLEFIVCGGNQVMNLWSKVQSLKVKRTLVEQYWNKSTDSQQGDVCGFICTQSTPVHPLTLQV